MSESGGPFEPGRPWFAHDRPERPLDEWCWICGCVSCQLAVRAMARRRPQLALVLKGDAGRVVVSCKLAAEVWGRTQSLFSLLPVGDFLREVFVSAGAPDLPHGHDRLEVAVRSVGQPRA